MGVCALALATLVGGFAEGPDGECERGGYSGGIGGGSGGGGGGEIHMFNLTLEPPPWRVSSYRWVRDPTQMGRILSIPAA